MTWYDMVKVFKKKTFNLVSGPLKQAWNRLKNFRNRKPAVIKNNVCRRHIDIISPQPANGSFDRKSTRKRALNTGIGGTCVKDEHSRLDEQMKIIKKEIAARNNKAFKDGPHARNGNYETAKLKKGFGMKTDENGFYPIGGFKDTRNFQNCEDRTLEQSEPYGSESKTVQHFANVFQDMPTELYNYGDLIIDEQSESCGSESDFTQYSGSFTQGKPQELQNNQDRTPDGQSEPDRAESDMKLISLHYSESMLNYQNIHFDRQSVSDGQNIKQNFTGILQGSGQELRINEDRAVEGQSESDDSEAAVNQSTCMNTFRGSTADKTVFAAKDYYSTSDKSLLENHTIKTQKMELSQVQLVSQSHRRTVRFFGYQNGSEIRVLFEILLNTGVLYSLLVISELFLIYQTIRSILQSIALQWTSYPDISTLFTNSSSNNNQAIENIFDLRVRRENGHYRKYWMVCEEVFSDAIRLTAAVVDLYYTVIYPEDSRMNLYLPVFAGGFIYEKDVIDDRIPSNALFDSAFTRTSLSLQDQNADDRRLSDHLNHNITL